MGFISDAESLKLGKQVLSPDEFEEFSTALERFRHFDDCLATNTPSPHCENTDPVKNLEGCRIGLKIENVSFEYWLGEVLHRAGIE